MSKSYNDPRILRGMEKQLRLRQDRLNAGEKSIGWKVGFGAPAALEHLRLDAPLIGFLTDKTLLHSNATISIAGWTKPAMEPEIAVYMGKDLTEASDRERTPAAIASLGPAIELADVHFPPDDVEAILAWNIYNRHIILGRADPSRAGCVLNGLTGRISRNGQDMPPVTELQALTGDIIDIVSHTANLLSMLGETLRAGEVIIAGSIVPPLWIELNEEIHYYLDPIDTISINVY
ncbi:MAG: fumarylacetoacetate hydrolase family protein [Anaerolineales bacterium]|nr:fumarylacetoacetate hydrolase family protein [Anaerolineales bacterium]